MDKKKLIAFTSFVYKRKCVPGLGFVTNILENKIATYEFKCGDVPCIAIIDSNVSSFHVLNSIPGNDDSIICLNYYAYFFSYLILRMKMQNFMT